MPRVMVVTWAPGGNLPPLLAAGALMAAGGHEVEVLASAATRAEAQRAGFDVHGYRRAPEPEVRVAFEHRAQALMAIAAGAEVALDVRDLLRDRRPDLAIADCMLPGAAAAAAATGTPTASLVHFLYGLARRRMQAGGGAWTTDLATLNETRRLLGLPALSGGLEAWESSELVLVTAPRWLDLDVEYPPHVVHAGPLGIGAHPQRRTDSGRPKVLLSFSTTVMDGQPRTIRTACEGVAATGAEAVLTLGPAVGADAIDAPDGVEVLAWADHDELLHACAAVVTHAGLGTTLRALAHGVPLLLLPLGRDQHFNATRVAELGAGIRLPADATAGRVAAALTALLSEPRYASTARRLAKRIAGDDPDRRAAHALERAARRDELPAPHRLTPKSNR